jgi:hypothetical protein
MPSSHLQAVTAPQLHILRFDLSYDTEVYNLDDGVSNQTTLLHPPTKDAFDRCMPI